MLSIAIDNNVHNSQRALKISNASCKRCANFLITATCLISSCVLVLYILWQELRLQVLGRLVLLAIYSVSVKDLGLGLNLAYNREGFIEMTTW